MKASLRATVFYYRVSITAVSILLLGVSSFSAPPSLVWPGVIAASFIALLFNYPLTLLNRRINLAHVIALTAGLLYGPVLAGWAVLLGILCGYAVQIIWLSHPRHYHFSPPIWIDVSFGVGSQILPLVLAFTLTGGKQGIPSDTAPGSFLSQIILLALLYTTINIAIFVTDYLLQRQPQIPAIRREVWIFVLVEVLPLPFILSLVYFFSNNHLVPLILIGSNASILAYLIFGFRTTRSDLERRLQELSTLDHISGVLRSTLDLQNLLAVIHEQVTHLLDVDNFYVALYDEQDKRIWYPLAVKHGRRQQWAPRPLMVDRLTDRVIHEGKHILLTPSTMEDLGRTGLPASEETPNAWMGVPLVTPERTTGCLAVFALTPATEFTKGDLNLLTILSGQVSVAIENALLYDQAHRRLAQLETLNRISVLISASLDQQEVLGQVCQSITEVGGAQRSAIFLLEPEKGLVSLAYAFRLSPRFAKENASFSVTQNERMLCLRMGKPVLTPDLSASPNALDYLASLREEGIQALGEFPLTTPDGQIGFLGVYFDSPRSFHEEEIELLQTFASQAAQAVSNARLYSHVDTALTRRAYQLSILESVGRELSAAINSERLFEMILDYALEFTISQWGELSLYNFRNSTLEVKASRGYPVARTQYSLGEGLGGRAVSTQHAVNVGDVSLEPNYIDLTGGEARSSLSIPLNHEGRVLGVITIESQRQNAYTQNDQAFISQLAVQAAVAVVNAELYSETQRRLREQSILYLVSTRLMGNPGPESVMQTLARSMEAALLTPSVGIYLWDESEATYTSRYYAPSSTHPKCHLPAVIPYADLESLHPSLVKTGPLRLSPKRGWELLGDCNNCQALVFPLIANKQRLGMVLMHVAKMQVVTEEELQLLRAIVAQVSISLQNALLFSDVTLGRDRMAAILNSVEEGILMMDSSGRILLANEFIKTATGLPPEEVVVNKHLSNLPDRALRALGYTREAAEGLIQSLAQSQTFDPHKTILSTIETKSERVLERWTSPVLGQNERVIGWMIVLRDITEEYQINQARELITSTLVHDLRSPVSATLSAVEIIRDHTQPECRDDITSQALRVAHNSATRVLGLIESLLDIARMQSGRMEVNLTALNLYQLASNCLGEFTSQACEFNVSLHNTVADSLPHISGDASKLTRVFTNLIDNALKFTPSGGQVSIAASLNQDDSITIQVSDTGPGIPSEYREKIFDRFTQVPGQRGRRRGSGLGLTFCRMAVEAHGGRIWVEPRPEPDTGCVFTINLPVSDPRNASRENIDEI